ncbi:uncharacterized protein LOC110456421 [Mizuhopecten yessoensis]|uniref:Cubilin n=1 Tax=Mizuhopecten yessoensis TaxID=6573 RepID=A0A210QAX6_MIZYE|nr:uncharacterized protein LOC110456421 [Mizuhopecten yessoensis]XP_021362853.1 uncharacterized protein LOC110456421 [Mizuhopecten yessoensis]OWF45883.1 Cubilin [Mizuhopecten yessoensis]
MEYSQKIISVAILSFTMIVQCMAGTPMSASACFAQKSLTFKCGYGYMLRITRTLYGHNSAGLCSLQPGDCVEEERKLYPCVGRESCSINLPSGGVGRVISSCNKPSNYFHVEYECIPVSDTKNICDSPVITAQQGYIITPGYPNNYGSNINCTARIQVESYQHLQLYILDLDLEMASSTCSDFMLAQDTIQSLTLCGKRGNEPSPVSWKNLTLRLSTNSRNNYKGFWLYYEATPALTTTTQRPTSPMATNHKTPQPVAPSSTTGEHTLSPKHIIPITKTVNNVNVDKAKTLPFAAIVGGVIGTLSFVLVILLVLLIVKWSRERKRRRDKNQFIEVQNPGYRNSNEFQQNAIPRTDVCYNYVDC